MFPWTLTLWQQLQERARQRQLPHAILLHGPAGVGKQQFAIEFAQSLLCESPGSQAMPCGQCRACVQFQAQTHPDYHCISPEADSRVIKIDQIRQLCDSLSLSSHHAGYRPIIIAPAEAMNPAAANSLLKTLEEPPAHTLLVLISHQPSLLSATIRSRCQRLTIGLPPSAQAREWLVAQLGEQQVEAGTLTEALALNLGAPLPTYAWLTSGRADQYGQAFTGFCAIGQATATALDVAAKWLKADQGVPIHWVYQWIGELVRIKSGQPLPDRHPQRLGLLQKLAQQVDLGGLFELLSELTETLRRQGGAMNQQLVYESILLRWAELTRRNLSR
jgi:DNA polymerase III subunit delta'